MAHELMNTVGPCIPLDGRWKELVDDFWDVLGFGIGEGHTFALLRHVETGLLNFVIYLPASPVDLACPVFLTGGVLV